MQMQYMYLDVIQLNAVHHTAIGRHMCTSNMTSFICSFEDIRIDMRWIFYYIYKRLGVVYFKLHTTIRTC